MMFTAKRLSDGAIAAQSNATGLRYIIAPAFGALFTISCEGVRVGGRRWRREAIEEVRKYDQLRAYSVTNHLTPA